MTAITQQEIQQEAVIESTTQCARAGQLFRIWNGELYPETITALEALNITVVSNTQAADPTKQYVFYDIQELNT